MQTTKEAMPKRFVVLELWASKYYDAKSGQYVGQDRVLKRFKNPACDFVITKTRGAVSNQATINIANLPKADIEDFTTFRNETILGGDQRRLALYAGYEGQKEARLFTGDIRQALPTVRPDIWLECTCQSGYFNNLGLASLAMNGPIKIKDIGAKAAQLLNLGYEWRAPEELNKTIDNFYFTGGITQIMQKLSRLAPLAVWSEDGVLIIDAENRSTPLAAGPVLEINKNTGMIGLPRPDIFGVKFTTLLNPNAKLGQEINLTSEAIPAANGHYFVYGLTHRGNYRGNAFYTEFDCWRFNYAK